MPNEFVARNGIIALNNSIITGSLNVTQGVTASLQGTASWANNAISSSYATNGGVTQIIAGTNVTISPVGGLGAVTINSTATGGGGGSITVADEGLTQGTASYFNFTGAGVTATVSNNTASISIPGGGGSSTGYLNTSFDGMGSVILINTLDYYRVPKAGTITGWSVIANGTWPTMSFDVWVTGSDGAIPTSANSICGGNFPFISGSRNAITSSTLTNWTASFSADSVFAVNVRSSSVATKASILLDVTWS